MKVTKHIDKKLFIQELMTYTDLGSTNKVRFSVFIYKYKIKITYRYFDKPVEFY